MAVQKETPFIAYSFTSAEEIQAVVFTDLQLKHLQSEMAIVATEKINLAFTPENPLKFQMEHEYLRGKLEILAYIISLHESTQSEVARALAEQQQGQFPNPQ